MDECTDKIVGFHGTTKKSAKSILQSNNFIVSKDDEEWLGPGVYFFEDDIRQAYYYCVKAKKICNWSILKSDIYAKVIIDLVDTETLEYFEIILNKVKSRYLKRADGRPRKLMNSVILNIMYEAEPYDVVRGIFQVPSTRYLPRTNLMRLQKQICVRNLDCIKMIMEVDYSE